MEGERVKQEDMAAERSAFLAIVGRPNVGKSSLLNRMIGEKIAIVSKKPQTTRTRIMGVLTQGADQLVFLDTPGLVKPKNSLGDYMAKSVASAVAGVGRLPAGHRGGGQDLPGGPGPGPALCGAEAPGGAGHQ